MRGAPLAMVIALLLGLLLPRAKAQEPPKSPRGEIRLTLVMSGELPPYLLAAEAFIKALEEAGFTPRVTQHTLKKGTPSAQVLQEINASAPDLLLTLGTQASREVGLVAAPVPTVFALVLDPSASGLPALGQAQSEAQGHITGVTMDIPLDVYLRAIEEGLPSATNIGLLAGPSTQAHLPELEAQTSARGMTLISASLKGEREVSRALATLAPKIDVLIAKPDPAVYTQGSTRYILLQTLRQGLPLVGPSEGFVDGGALMGVGLSYGDLGAQAGAMGVRILEGEAPGAIPVEDPQETRLLLNLRTARLIGIKPSPLALEYGEVRVQ